jgi:hypothetical protein
METNHADQQVTIKRQGRAPRHKGQVLVIFAVSLFALLFFVGFAVDAGVTYVNYGQLKRAVDAGAVAAANNFKRGATSEEMYAAVLETLKLQNMNVDPSSLQLKVEICDSDGDGVRDVALLTEAPDFYAMCPDTTVVAARKLVWVEAQQHTPFYFLSLLGFNYINLRTSSTAEAAAVDLVLVLDTSESMAAECANPVGASVNACATFKTPGYGANRFDYDPHNCNAYYDAGHQGDPAYFHDSECYPLRDSIDAAKSLVNTLYEGYDNISLITFDSVAHTASDPDYDQLYDNQFGLTGLLGGNKTAVLQKISETQLHDDAPYGSPPSGRMWAPWYVSLLNKQNLVNPANMEDRDGDGQDADSGAPCWVNRTPDQQQEVDLHWDNVLQVPCDYDPTMTGLSNPTNDPGTADAFDWNKDQVYTADDNTAGSQWLSDSHNSNFSLVSTCTGCGMRAASNELKARGRPGAVWVIIFISDGAVNMSDTYASVGNDADLIPANFKNGFCTKPFWGQFCMDNRPQDKSTTTYNPPYRDRYCIDKPAIPNVNPGTCPPGSTWLNRNILPTTVNYYSVFDYALDMVDEAALRTTDTLDPLLKSRYNKKEPIGNDVAIYSIGLGPAVTNGVPLLRYMAAVGDDGDRVTDPCLDTLTKLPLPPKTSCGQYYYAALGSDLAPIFDNIASRIYTKITR